MKFGSIEGKVDGLHQVIYDSGVLDTATTTITISGLEGDSTKEYAWIVFQENDYDGAAGIYLRPNNDTTGYGYHYIYGMEATISGARNATYTSMLIAYTNAVNNLSLGWGNMLTKSGVPRYGECMRVRNVDTSSVGITYEIASVWNDTSAEITSMVFYANQTNGFGVGSRVILMEKTEIDAMKTGDVDPQGKIEGAWELIAETEVAEATTGVTFSGLTGDTDCIYRLIAVTKNYDTGAATSYLRFNGDSGSNYGLQYVKGVDTTLTALEGSPLIYFVAPSLCTSAGGYSLSDILIYAPSGNVRIGLMRSVYEVSSETVTQTRFESALWTNTADELTTMYVYGVAGAIDAGSHYMLFRLNP